jgi:hypothetical protein
MFQVRPAYAVEHDQLALEGWIPKQIDSAFGAVVLHGQQHGDSAGEG